MGKTRPGHAVFWPARDHNGWRHPPDNKAHSCKRGLMSRYWSSITDAAVNVEISNIQGECIKRIFFPTYNLQDLHKLLRLFIIDIFQALNLFIKATLSFLYLYLIPGFWDLQGFLSVPPDFQYRSDKRVASNQSYYLKTVSILKILVDSASFSHRHEVGLLGPTKS